MRSGADGWMDVARTEGTTPGLSRLERLMVTHRRYIILERMWDGRRVSSEGRMTGLVIGYLWIVRNCSASQSGYEYKIDKTYRQIVEV